MDKDSIEFWQVKAEFLQQENSRLREALLDAQIQAGHIGFSKKEDEKAE